jgi:hypothetical protein
MKYKNNMNQNFEIFNQRIPTNPAVCAILLERNSSLLARGIRWFMNIYRKMKKLGPKKPRHNHAEILIYVKGLGLLTVGAVKGGFRPRRFVDQMPRKHWKNLQLFVSRPPLTDQQRRAITRQVVEYSFGELHPYEYFNFISWIVKIATFGKVNISKKSAKRMECYEAVARCYNAGGDYFPTPEYTDIFQFYYNEKLKPLDNWEEYVEALLQLENE